MSGASLIGSGSSGSNVSITARAAGPVELSETDNGALRLQTDTPHLVSMGGGRLSTAVTLHPIPPGRVTIGNGPNVDISVQGKGVQPLHCQIENASGIVTLYPLSEQISIDGSRVTTPTRLVQGVMLTIGHSNYMRFNHPAEAKLMKAVLPNSRISMAPISFEVDSYHSKFNKKPPAVPKRSPRDSLSDADESSGCIMSKVNKFEYLAAQNFNKAVSPKVFSSNSVTVNTPAKDVLGKAPPDLQCFTKNLPQSAVNYSECHNEKKPTKMNTGPVFGQKSQYVNVAVNDTSKNCNSRVNVVNENGVKQKNSYENVEAKYMNNNRSFEQSPKNNYGRVATPSPSFNRNPSPYRSATPKPLVNRLDNRSGSVGDIGPHVTGVEIHELVWRNNEAEIRRNQAQAERMKEQEDERAEKARLEEILNMCAEYERQVQLEKNNKATTPNRIKTNGSLSRDKRPSVSPSQTSDDQVFHFDVDKSPKDTNRSSPAVYENVSINQFQQVVVHSTPNSDSSPRARRQYKNVEIGSSNGNSPYENVYIVPPGTPHYPHSPRTRIKTCIAANKDCSIKTSDNTSAFPKETENNESVSKKKAASHKFVLHIEKPDESHKSENEKSRIERLRAQKREVMHAMVTLKRKIADIEMQEEELIRELEMEKALLTGEHQSKVSELEELEKLKVLLLAHAKQIEKGMEDCRITQAKQQTDAKQKLQNAQSNVNKLETELQKLSKTSSTYPDLLEELNYAREQLECEKKTFEDLEFHHLEEEADWLASREETQREILDLSQKIEHKKSHITDLDSQKVDAFDHTALESKTLERQLLKCLRKLEECRGKLRVIDAELHAFSDRDSDEVSSDSDSERKSGDGLENMKHLRMQLASMEMETKKCDDIFNMSQSFNEKLLYDKSILDIGGPVAHKCPSQDDIDRISKVTSNAPLNIEDGNGSLGRKTIESLKEIERNRQLHLAQQGSQVIEQERRRVLALKQRVQDEVRAKWAQSRHKDCASLNSTGSEDNQLESVSGSDETEHQSIGGGGGSVATGANGSGNDHLVHQLDIKLRSEESEGPDSPRPMSESSELSCDTGASLPGGTLTRRARSRPSTDKHRPLTRYLPIKSTELDLRQHIESAGHQVDLCPHVTLNSTTCKGFLHKMGSKLHGWSRRWFVFDRTKRTLVYYSDKSEKKMRGGAYFQAIEEVYLDHLNTAKSPNPHLTFVIKTHERSYYLMAPSLEAMRIWVDVVFTGAEGYHEFEPGT